MKALFLLSVLSVLIYARIEQDNIPEELADCYSKQPHTVDGQNTCLGEYLSHLHQNSSSLHISAVKWIDSLGRNLHLRLKRQSSGGQYGGGRKSEEYRGLRVRKEIRTLSDDELEIFFDAVKELKNDKSVFPNKYDAFALTHQGLVIPSAHDGPNFVGWHRYLLTLFEDALRTKRRRVTLPYWDSTLDFRMKKPEDTVLFSELLIGNGKGVVFNGPFAIWETPSDNTLLRRNIPGPRSSLINPDRLKHVFTKRYHREILVPTAAKIDDNLEYHHDAVHRWVGTPNGHMADPNLAAMDPVFFLHHCYIDYLWEKFRERQKRLGINSEKDYPKTNLTLHAPDRPMDNLEPPIRNVEGYSNRFTRRIYRYADAPSCYNRCGGGRNVFLYCDKKKNGCVSRSRQEFESERGFTKIRFIYGTQGIKRMMNTDNVLNSASSSASASPVPVSLMSPQNDSLSTQRAPSMSRTFTARIIDPRTSGNGRTRRSIDIEKTENRVKIGLDINLILKEDDKHSSSRSFVSNVRKDVAIAPIIIHSITEKAVMSFTNESLSFLKRNKKYEIKFETIGLSYFGHSDDTINFDSRVQKSESVVAISFLKPKAATQIYVRVSDMNGKICQPTCLVGRGDYQECTGALKITPDIPLMYMDPITGGQSTSPYLKFYCAQ